MVSDDGAWVAIAVSAIPVQRAQFTFSTQGIVTHSKAQGGEAGAHATFFMSARLKPLETLSLSLARLCAAQSCTSRNKDEQAPPLTLPVPGRPYSKSHVSRLREHKCGQGVALSAPTPAQAADMTHLLLAGACAF